MLQRNPYIDVHIKLKVVAATIASSSPNNAFQHTWQLLHYLIGANLAYNIGSNLSVYTSFEANHKNTNRSLSYRE